MNHFLRGFGNELMKIGAFPQHEVASSYDSGSSVAAVMKQVSGSGLKGGRTTLTPPAPTKRAPTPLTTPNQMVGYSAGQQ